jgi:hypothetical protein
MPIGSSKMQCSAPIEVISPVNLKNVAL